VKKVWLALGTVALGVVLAIGLSQTGGGSGNPESAAPDAANVARQLEGAPEPLARVHRQANELLPGGATAFRARIDALEGHPVVVNKWASWCGPCRAEFPDFQKASVKYGKRVAFLGVDSNDNRGDAAGFLKRFPVSYPSYEDPSGTVAAEFNASAAFPATAFYDRKGNVVFLHQGQYPNLAELEDDIKRYALR
jgi:thiol-disulfide isomerase/thioredoxin